MSEEELIFKVDPNHQIIVTFKNNELLIKSSDNDGFFAFSRGEAYFLMLYLQEHLK